MRIRIGHIHHLKLLQIGYCPFLLVLILVHVHRKLLVLGDGICQVVG
jgi:hypothetical protein